MQNTVPLCGGTIIPTSCTGGGYEDKNPFFYRFTCFTAGTLGFLIDPINNNDDYDWVLFDITGRNPDDIYINSTLNVAENWSATPGNTGASAAGLAFRNCAGNTPNFSRMPSIIAGNEYLLMVSNWSASQQGYALTFNGGTAVIADPVSPKLANAYVDCAGQVVTVLFNKSMRCNSLAADRSDFVLSPAFGTIAGVTGYGCLSGFDMDSVSVTFASPLPPGTYTLTMANGTDANTLLDICGTPIPVGNGVTFTVNPAASLPMGTVTPPPCAPTSLTLTFADPIKCNSIAANGSDFTITGPSAVTVSSATAVNCNANGETNTITVQLSAPILVGGNYQVNAATGTDGNTLIGSCNRQVTAGTSTPLTITAQTPVAMGTVTPPACTPSTITLTFAEPVLCNSVAANGSDFTITGPSAVTITSAAAVNCNAAGETTTITIQLSAPILVTGNYTVQMATGTDGNTVVGQCSRQVTAGDNTPFTLAAQTAIAMGNVTPPPCTPTSITLTFAEPVLCNSVAANGSDFIITGPSAVTVSSATAVNCNASGETTTITIQLSAPILVTGAYNVQMATGTDGNTLTGNCGRQTTAGATAPFTLAAQVPVTMGTAALPGCVPQLITLTFTEPIKCNSIAANGSDFIIAGPSAVTVSSAVAVNCNASGETTTITIQLSAPILVGGSYNVQMATGTDGNTLIGSCNRQVTAGALAPFIITSQPAIAMGTVAPPPCTPQSITLTFADPINCNSVAANGSDFIISGPSGVTISSAAAVNCNASGETTTITIQLSAPILITGNYTVQIATGSDGNTLTGQCGRQVTAGSNTQFVLAPQLSIPMGTIPPPPCTPQSMTLTFADPILCNSIAANGSDFIIIGPSAVTISSATAVNCNANGETTTITIQVSAPILVTGSYTVQVANGSDGNTLIGQCNRQVPAGSNTQFVLAPQPAIPMGTIPPPNCSPSSITLNFTENILCNSIAANGSDFIITGPAAVTITSATGTCNATGETTTITLQLSAPIIVSGNFQVQMVAGSDGNTLIGNCNRRTTAGESAPFTIPPAAPVLMDSLVPIACSPSSLKLVFAAPIRCSSIAANGSDFIITGGPAAITVASAAGVCDANGLTTSINIQLASPVVTAGVYSLQLVTGSDGNTLLSDCNRPTPAAQLNFATVDTVSAEFQYQVQYDCQATNIISFSHDGQHNVNQWTWTVNGTAASTSQTFTQNFPASGQNQVQLVVSNGVCSDTYSIPINLNNKITVDFEVPESVCPEDTLTFINKSTGQIDTWQWSFGNANTSGLQNPPAQVYPLTGTETLYTISLTAGNNNFGCQVTTTKTLKVLSACIIAVPSAFTPNNDGKNDYFYPLNAIKAEKLDFKVFNRWGQLIFHSKDWRQKWDGTFGGVMQATGVYIWMLDFTHKDTKQKYSMRGTVTLIR